MYTIDNICIYTPTLCRTRPTTIIIIIIIMRRRIRRRRRRGRRRRSGRGRKRRTRKRRKRAINDMVGNIQVRKSLIVLFVVNNNYVL